MIYAQVITLILIKIIHITIIKLSTLNKLLTKLSTYIMTKRAEHQIQKSCVTWFGYQYPHLKLCLFSVPNGFWVKGASRLNLQMAMVYLKDEGLQTGVPDLVLMYNGKAYGIELKTNTGTLSDKQVKVHEAWKKQRIDTFIVRTFEEFKELIQNIVK